MSDNPPWRAVTRLIRNAHGGMLARLGNERRGLRARERCTLNMRLLIAAIVLSCGATPAAAAKATRVTTDANGGNQYLVCHREKVTGTHIRVTVCRHQSEIKQDREDAKRYLHESARINTRGSASRSGAVKR